MIHTHSPGRTLRTSRKVIRNRNPTQLVLLDFGFIVKMIFIVKLTVVTGGCVQNWLQVSGLNGTSTWQQFSTLMHAGTLTHARTHRRTHARARAHTHTHTLSLTHTHHCFYQCPVCTGEYIFPVLYCLIVLSHQQSLIRPRPPPRPPRRFEEVSSRDWCIDFFQCCD